MRIRKHEITPTLTALLPLLTISTARAQSANPNPPTPPAAPATPESDNAQKLAALVRQAVAIDPTKILQKAEEVEAAGNFQTARTMYYLASKSFEAHGQPEDAQKAMLKSNEMRDKAAATQNATPDAAQPTQPEEPAPVGGASAAAIPMSKSAIVHPNKHGDLAVTTKGVKLSRYDSDMTNPRITVAPNGTIHVAFIERTAQSPFTYSVYHRSSSDGGKSWSAAKNLSEVMPDYGPGLCQIAADGGGRVYVIWRTQPHPNVASSAEPYSASADYNLVYRVLEGGVWSKAVFVYSPIGPQDIKHYGSASYFVSTDPTGKVHVIWNGDPGKLHPEATWTLGTYAGVGMCDILGVTLNGATPSAPQEIYQAKIVKDASSAHSEDMSLVNGYVDARGQAHVLALVSSTRLGQETPNRFQIIENGTQTTAVELPGLNRDYWSFEPTLLLDAQGKRHVITWYLPGDAPGVRDYIIGDGAEPTVIRAIKGTHGVVNGFQAYQGPGGQMIVLMQMNDTGDKTGSELYVSTSNGGKWTTPVNVTNNTGRIDVNYKAIGSRSSVTNVSYLAPGVGAAALDRSGHLVLTYICVENKSFGTSAFGVGLAGNSSATPELLFLRF